MSKMPQIPGYQLIKKLGQGGMADVYLGVQEKLQRHVAIKVMVPALFRDDQFSKRFVKEAQTAAQLSHPNIITIHDVGEAEHSHYIVMEYLEETLSDRLTLKKCLPPREALEIVKMIAGALDYAHKKGFIHRDIKPDNIMFRGDGTVVLVDFGIARAMDSGTHLTRTGMSIGTPHYMSPEQCKGEKIDGRSDIYSLGVQLYELLTGKVPYEAENTAGIIIKQIQDPVPTLPPHLSQYQFLIDKMMAKNRELRIQSGAELIKYIEGVMTAQAQRFMPPPTSAPEETFILDGPTVQSPRSSILRPPSTRVELRDKKKWLIPTLAAAAIVVILAVALILIFTPKPEDNIKETDALLNDQGNQTQPLDNKTGPGEKDNKGEQVPPAEKDGKPSVEGSGNTGNTGSSGNTTKTGDAGSHKDVIAKDVVPDSKHPVEKQSPDKNSGSKNTGKTGDTSDTVSPVSEKKTPQKTPIESLKEQPVSSVEVKTVSLLGLSPELQRQNAMAVLRIQIPVLLDRFQVQGQIILDLLINEYGRVSITSYQDLLTVTPALRERQVKGAIKRRFDTLIFPAPKDDQGNPVRFKWRLTFKVGKYLDKIILTRQ